MTFYNLTSKLICVKQPSQSGFNVYYFTDKYISKMIVPDEVVIEALLKDARKFKSKWELHTGEPTRSKPNVHFLKRTLSNVVKVNEDRMRKPQNVEIYDKDINSSKHEKKKCDLKESSDSKEPSRSRSRGTKRSKKSGCSKSKYRSPESRSRSSKKSSKRKKDASSTKRVSGR